jgi:hypothetical protein
MADDFAHCLKQLRRRVCTCERSHRLPSAWSQSRDTNSSSTPRWLRIPHCLQRTAGYVFHAEADFQILDMVLADVDALGIPSIV